MPGSLFALFRGTDGRSLMRALIALALLNAFAHRDYRLGGPVIVKEYADRLDVHSPGGFIGGVSPA